MVTCASRKFGVFGRVGTRVGRSAVGCLFGVAVRRPIREGRIVSISRLSSGMSRSTGDGAIEGRSAAKEGSSYPYKDNGGCGGYYKEWF